jgi:hypothetical protein
MTIGKSEIHKTVYAGKICKQINIIAAFICPKDIQSK